MKYATGSLLVISTTLMGETLIPKFSQLQSLEDSAWQTLEFRNIEQHSRYSLEQVDGVTVVRAETDNSASGLIARKRIDPNTAPIIEWRWRVSNIYEKGDAGEKSGDDYPARIYVAFAFEPTRAGFFEKAARAAASVFHDEEILGTALNYIWANKLEIDSVVPNAFSDKTRMIAVDSGPEKTGRWVLQHRNIMDDYKQAFGREPPEIVGIGIMSDSDNTGESATAWYGDISLSSDHVQ